MSRSRSWKDRLGQDKLVVEPVSAIAPPLPTTARKLARLLVVLSVAAILFCGYFPFDFNFQAGLDAVGRRFDSTLMQRTTAGDSIENLLFFMPFGFALGAVLRRRWLPYWIGTALVALVISAAFSTLIEVGQAFLSMRDPSLTDVFNNSLGGLGGFAIYRFAGDPTMKAIGRAIEAVEQKMGAAMLATIGLVYAAAVCAAPIILGADAANLGAWSANYPLAIGDEFGGQRRSWDGVLWNLDLATTAANRDQLTALFLGTDPIELFGTSLIASYDLRGGPPFPDRTGKNPPLESGGSLHFAAVQSIDTPATRPATRPIASSGPAHTTTLRGASTRAFAASYDRWLRTPAPVVAINRGIAAARQFTAIVTCASARPNQYQGARIATISLDTARRNLTLGQDGPRLIIRVRNQVNGENGAAPEFVLDDVFNDTRPHKIILTYAGGALNVYIDGLRWKASARITPEAATIWSMFPRSYWSFSLNSDEVSVNTYVYRTIVFLPLGALAAATVNQTKKRHRERVMMASALIGATIVVMEALITTIGGQPFNPAAAILSAGCGAIGVIAVRIRHGDRTGAWALV